MNRDSRSFRSWGALIAIVIVGALCFCRVDATAREALKGKKGMTVAEKYVEQEKLLKQKLSVARIWTDLGRRSELLNCLKTAGTLRAMSIAPIIVSRIVYNPSPWLKEKKKLPLWFKYPVYGALKSIGIPALPHLLAELRKTNPRNGEENRLKHVLLIFCIQAIYDQGGRGTVLAKKRLELELAATKDEKARANLKAALAHPIFQADKKTAKK